MPQSSLSWYKGLRTLPIVLLIATIFVSQSMAQPSNRSDKLVISQSELDKLVKQHPLFSGSVMIAQDGDMIAAAYTGFSNRKTDRSNNRDTLHCIASVGKLFTAVAIAQLVESGKCDYTSAVVDLLPELKDQISEDVTVDHLLHHKSGLTQISGVDDETLEALGSNADYFALILEKGIHSDGPAGFKYRNENFQLLGAIIEKLSNQPYESYIQKHIVKPSGMAGPQFIRSDRSNDPSVAQNYLSVDYETWWNSTGPIPAESAEAFVHVPPSSTPSAGGGAYATAEDMIRFAKALREGTLISRESFLSMSSLSPQEEEKKRGYGRGCSVDLTVALSRFGHTGSTAGVQARFYLYWENGVDVIVLTNHDGQAAPLFNALDKKIRKLSE